MKLKKKKEKRKKKKLLSDYNKYIIIFLNLEFVKKTLYILEKWRTERNATHTAYANE